MSKDRELFDKALHNAVYWQNRCCELTEVVEQLCMGAEEIVVEREAMAKEVEAVCRANMDCVDYFNQMRAELEAIKVLVTKLHSAKGRYHTQLAACDLFDKLGLKNERPTK